MENARWLRAQYETTRVLAESTTLREVVPKMLKAICESLEWSYGAVWTVDRGANRLCCLDTWHAGTAEFQKFDKISCERTFAEGEGLPGRVWASGKPEWIRDVSHDP